MRLIEEAPAALDEKHRLVFLLRDVEGLSVREMAEALGLSEANVKVRLLRAWPQLREQLTRAFGDPARRLHRSHADHSPLRHGCSRRTALALQPRKRTCIARTAVRPMTTQRGFARSAARLWQPQSPIILPIQFPRRPHPRGGAAQPPTVDPRLRQGGSGTLVTGAKTYAQGKTPWVAVLLSVLIPGVGQFYNGDMKKGGIMLGAAILLGWTVIVWLVVLVWSAIDAYNVASGKAPLW